MNEQHINDIYRCRLTMLDMLYDRFYDTNNCMDMSLEEFTTIVSIENMNVLRLTAIDLHSYNVDGKKKQQPTYDIDSNTIEEDLETELDEPTISETEDTSIVESKTDMREGDNEKIYELTASAAEESDLDISDDDEESDIQFGGGDKNTVSKKEIIVKFLFDDNIKKSIELLEKILQDENNPDKDYQIIVVICSNSIKMVSKDDKGVLHLKPYIHRLENDRIQVFHYKSLIINITKHQYVPRHVLIKDKREIRDILDFYSLKDTRGLPAILTTDPICKYYNGKVGNIFKIYRSVGEIVYRGVISN